MKRELWLALVWIACGAGCDAGEPTATRDAATTARPASSAARYAEAIAPVPVLAWIDGEPLDADAVRPLTDSSPEARSEALQHAIDRRLAADEARRRELDAMPWVRDALEVVRAEARRAEDDVWIDALAVELAGADSVSDATLRAAFEAEPARFARPRYTLRTSRYATREAADAAARTLAETGFLADTVFEDLGPGFAWELPEWLRSHLARLDAPGKRIVLPLADGFALVEVSSLEVVPPPDFEAARHDLLRALRRSEVQPQLLREIERLRAEHEIRIDGERR